MHDPEIFSPSAHLLLPIALATALLAMTACGKSPGDRLAEAAASAATSAASGHKVEIERDGDKVTIKSKDGKEMMDISAGDDIKLPKDFPDDVYLPPKYKVMTSMKMGPAMMVNLIAPGSLQAVRAGRREDAGARLGADHVDAAGR